MRRNEEEESLVILQMERKKKKMKYSSLQCVTKSGDVPAEEEKKWEKNTCSVK